MLQRLSETYRIPVPVLVFVSVIGLVFFVGVFGVATYSGLMTLWPAAPFALAVALAVVLPVAFVIGVGVYCAAYDKWAADPKMARRVKLLGLVGPAIIVAYLVYQLVR